jgi:NAD(P)-dependent dehydrogenase (short-subunit alcohol dehydrogenase family)
MPTAPTRTWLITGISSGFGRDRRDDRHQSHGRDPALPRRHPTPAGCGRDRIIQLSSYGGQVSFPGNSLYHATKWGIEGSAESVAQEVGGLGVGVTIVEPGGARTEFRHGSAQIAEPLPVYDGTPAHAFQAMLDPAAPPAPGDPALMAARIIETVDREPAPLRLVLGSQALRSTIDTLTRRLSDFESQTDLAASTDAPDVA